MAPLPQPRPPEDLPEDPSQTYSVDSTFATQSNLPFHNGSATRWRVVEAPVEQVSQKPEEPEYRLLQKIGRGGMGEVWEAVQSSLGRFVAIKTISNAALARCQNERERARLIRQFEMEAVVTARLEHPNIIPVHDRGQDEQGMPLIAMKRVHGRPWRDMVQEDSEALGPIDLLGRHVPILINVAQATAFAHSQGIVHRDIKPAQVMVGEFGEVHLIDWGLALDLETRDDRDSHAPLTPISLPTREVASCPSGTPALMAPEQTEETAANIGNWTDIYLLAGTLYFLLTGTYPHSAGSSAQSFARAAIGEIEDPRERAPERWMPEELVRTCMKGLARNPAERHHTAQEFIGELQDYLTGATRRRRSEELSAGVEEALRLAPANYEECASLLSRLGEAAGLWAANPQVAALRERALHAHAQLALTNGDLVLSRVQCRMMAEGAAKAALLARLEAAEEAIFRREARARRTAVVAAVFLILLVTGSVFFATVFRQQRDDIKEALHEVDTARKEAVRERTFAVEYASASQSLIDFMMGDLRDTLQPSVPRDKAIIDRVGQRITEHYEGLALDERDSAAMAERAQQLYRAAEVLEEFGLYPDSLALFEESYALQVTVAGAETVEAAAILARVASLQLKLGMHAAGLESSRSAMATLEQTAPPEDPRRLLALTIHASILRQHVMWPEAEAAYREALAIAEQHAPALEGQRANSLSQLANLKAYLGESQEAEALSREALEISEQILAPNDPGLAHRLEELATILKNRGEFDESIALLDRAIAIIEEVRGVEHPELVRALSTKAAIYYHTRRHEQAKEISRQLIRIQEVHYGRDHVYIAPNYQIIAAISVGRGEWEEAEANIQEALRLYTMQYGEESVYHIETLMTLAAILDNSGRRDEAEETFLRIFTLMDKFAPTHPNRGLTHANLAYLYLKKGEFEKSEAQVLAAIDILNQGMGRKHPFYGQTVEIAAQLYMNWSEVLEGDAVKQKLQQGVDFVRAQELEVRQPALNYSYSMSLLRLGEFDEARPLLKELIEIDILYDHHLEEVEASGIFDVMPVPLNADESSQEADSASE